MTIKDFIEFLQGFDPDTEIQVPVDTGYDGTWHLPFNNKKGVIVDKNKPRPSTEDIHFTVVKEKGKSDVLELGGTYVE